MAAVLAFADLEPVWIVVVMLVAWAVVALLEWAAWRERPHWASGSPPRYYVPQEPLPPRPPSMELPAFTAYPRPEARETESPTWIATPAMRDELLGWPTPPPQEQPTTVEELPDELLAEAAGAGWPDLVGPTGNGDRWEAFELPVEPEPEPAGERQSDNLSQAPEGTAPVESEAPASTSDDSSQAEEAAVPLDQAVPEAERDDSSQAGPSPGPVEQAVPAAARDNLSQAEQASEPATGPPGAAARAAPDRPVRRGERPPVAVDARAVRRARRSPSCRRCRGTCASCRGRRSR